MEALVEAESVAIDRLHARLAVVARRVPFSRGVRRREGLDA